MAENKKKKRGFAAMSPERRHEISVKGGAAERKGPRGFARDPELASAAGREGGLARTRNKPA